MDRKQLYDVMAERKFGEKDLLPYYGGNGRVDRCVDLFVKGNLRPDPEGVLLDVGGGIGDLCFALRDRFKSTFCVDISKKNLESASKKGVQGVLADVDQSGLPFGDSSVSTVIALDFIEHIIDPENFARECFRVLKPGGEVFVNTPNIQFYGCLESLLFRGVFPHTSGDRETYHGGHVSFFCLDDLQKIMGSVGFSNFRQFKDEESYRNPPSMFIDFLSPKNQEQYIDCCMRLGNSNLLFACVKP